MSCWKVKHNQYPSLQLRHVFLLLFPGWFLIYTFDVPRIIYKHLNPQRMFRIVSNAERIEQQKLRKLLQSHIRPSADVNACPWPPIGLHGRQKLNKREYSLEKLEDMYPFMDNGHYTPSCPPYQKIAIVVPYRDREKQLKVFINNVLPRIYRQNQEFGVYLVEQADRNPFNRGMLTNIGYQHAMREYQYDCIVIHDVDILPEDDRNLYFCNNKTAYHLAGRMERKKYTLPYPGFFGGISSLSILQYKNINGFSNSFFGWGGEDDDFKRRINVAGYKISRPLEIFSHCGDVEHEKAKPGKFRHKVFDKVRRLWKVEGLNTLKYQLIKKEKKKLYVWLYVNINMSIIEKSGVHIDGYIRNSDIQ